jgi:hypothetical protein
MGPNDVTTKEDLQALSRQAEAVQRAAAALASATRRARGVRLCLVLAVVLVIAVICLKFHNLGMSVQSPEYLNKLTKVGQERLAKQSDRYMGEFQKLVDHTSPALTQAFSDQVKKDMPEFIKNAEKEKDTLAANLQEEFSKRVNSHYEKLLNQQEQLLKERFPTVKDPASHERMIKNIDKAVQRMVKKYSVDDFRRQIDEIVATWEHFPEAPIPKPGEPSLMDQFIPTLLQYAALRFSTSGFGPRMTTASAAVPTTPHKP